MPRNNPLIAGNGWGKEQARLDMQCLHNMGCPERNKIAILPLKTPKKSKKVSKCCPITPNRLYVLKRLLEYKCEEGDERWMLLDTDHYTKREHQKSFRKAIKEAEEQGVRVALSRPCFEFWLLLHHLTRQNPGLQTLSTAKDVETFLRKTLGSYNKRNLKTEDFPLEKVPQAIREGRAIDASVTGGDIPGANTSRVYQLWESIIKNASPAQLPDELRNLKRSLHRP